jgi:hypothetical protein
MGQRWERECSSRDEALGLGSWVSGLGFRRPETETINLQNFSDEIRRLGFATT